MIVAGAAAALAALLTWGGGVPAAARQPAPAAACAPDSAARRDAAAQLAALDREIGGGADAGADLAALLAGDCFTFVRQAFDARGLRGDALRAWWGAGGAAWLRAELWSDAMVSRRIFFPPDPPPVFEPRASRLAGAIACAAPAGCAFDHAAAFLDDVVADMGAGREIIFGNPMRPSASAASCADTTSSAPPERRFGTWWGCVQHFRPRLPAAPLGAFRLPAAGWLRLDIERTRGFGGFRRCESSQTYDLETGAAFAASSCDGAAPTTAVGSIDPGRPRELALLIAVGDQIVLRRPAAVVELPEAIGARPPASTVVEDTTPLVPLRARDATRTEVKVTVTDPSGAGLPPITFLADWNHLDGPAYEIQQLSDANVARIARGCPPATRPAPKKAGALDRALSEATRAACRAGSGR
jgi:hypothetical protein